MFILICVLASKSKFSRHVFILMALICAVVGVVALGVGVVVVVVVVAVVVVAAPVVM